jgi:hypothetical protein
MVVFLCAQVPEWNTTQYTSSNENSNCEKHVSSLISSKEFPKFWNYHVSKCLHFFFLWWEKMDSDTANAYLPVSLGKTKYMFL